MSNWNYPGGHSRVHQDNIDRMSLRNLAREYNAYQDIDDCDMPVMEPRRRKNYFVD